MYTCMSRFRCIGKLYICIYTSPLYSKDITALGHAALLVALSREPEVLFIDRLDRW